MSQGKGSIWQGRGGDGIDAQLILSPGKALTGGGIGSKMLSGMGMTHASGFSTDYHTKIKTRAGLCSCFTTGYSLSWQERKDHFLSMTAEDQAGKENQPLFSFIAGLLERLSPSPPRQSIHSSNRCVLSVFHVSEGQMSKTGLIPIWGSSVRYNLDSSVSQPTEDITDLEPRVLPWRPRVLEQVSNPERSLWNFKIKSQQYHHKHILFG